MMALFDLSGKVSLVTGGNRGIGLAMAHALANAGSDVVIWGSNADRNAHALESLLKIPVRVAAQAVDVSDEAAVGEAMQQLLATFGRIDTAIANAGISGVPEPFATSSSQNMDAIFNVNIKGVYWVLREACRSMVERAKAGDPGGSLVGVASLGALFGMSRASAYSASKGAVASLMRSLASEHGRYGIRANTVAPGFIRTELNPGLDEDGPTKHVLPRIPLKRFGEGADCAGIAVYLASDASAYHSGDLFVIDGGFAVQ